MAGWVPVGAGGRGTDGGSGQADGGPVAAARWTAYGAAAAGVPDGSVGDEVAIVGEVIGGSRKRSGGEGPGHGGTAATALSAAVG